MSNKLLPVSMDDVIELNSSLEVPDVGVLDTNFLSINEEDISEDIERQAAYYAFWAVAVADAAREEATAKLNYKTVRAEVRRELQESSKKKRTIADLDAALDEDERVLQAKLVEIDAEHKHNMTKAIMYALQQKKDMLSSKSGLRRTELEVSMKELGARVLGGNKNES